LIYSTIFCAVMSYISVPQFVFIVEICPLPNLSVRFLDSKLI
jgi:hypothetical protein